MNYLIILFGMAIIVAGIITQINPDTVFGLMRRNMESFGTHVMAAVARIISGAALIISAIRVNMRYSQFQTAILYTIL